jgi:hypothetical protein
MVDLGKSTSTTIGDHNQAFTRGRLCNGSEPTAGAQQGESRQSVYLNAMLSSKAELVDDFLQLFELPRPFCVLRQALSACGNGGFHHLQDPANEEKVTARHTNLLTSQPLFPPSLLFTVQIAFSQLSF